jgi:hypothetical protein
MARQKHPKLNDLVRRGVDADDLDEMHYEEEHGYSTTEGVARTVAQEESRQDQRHRKRIPRRPPRAGKGYPTASES